MQRNIRKTSLVSITIFLLIWLLTNVSFGQVLTVEEQKDGTIKITSTPRGLNAQISEVILCRTIDDLVKDEKAALLELISENRYEEAKESIDIILSLEKSKAETCQKD